MDFTASIFKRRIVEGLNNSKQHGDSIRKDDVPEEKTGGGSVKRWVAERLRRMHAFTLRVLRIDRLELKLDYASAEMASLADRQSGQIDDALLTVSEKLERYSGQFESLKLRVDQMESAIRVIAGASRPPVFPAGENVIATEADGFILGLPGDEWRLAAYYALRGVPEPGMAKVFRQMVKPGMVIVDVGAHIGLYTLLALRSLNGAGKVFAFEPSPRTMSLLRDNIQVNGFMESGVARLLPLAVAARCGDAEFSIIPNNSGHNTLFAGDRPAGKLPVKTTTLDEALASELRIDVVKIDAEGAEPFILQGMSQIIGRNPDLRIFIEFAPEHLRRAGVGPLQWAEQILSSGFVVRRVEDVTGELIEVTAGDLAGCISWNLLLSPVIASP